MIPGVFGRVTSPTNVAMPERYEAVSFVVPLVFAAITSSVGYQDAESLALN